MLRADIRIHRHIGSVCRINILDKILVTGRYFKRFRSCHTDKGKRDIPPDIRQYTY